MDRLLASVKVLLITLLTVIFTPPIMLMEKLGHTRSYYRFVNLFWQSILRVMGFRITSNGLPERLSGTLIISNHISYMDVFVYGALMQARFTPKEDIRSWPVFGWLTNLSRPLYIDRSSRTSIKKQRQEMLEAMAQGDNFVVYAESTTSDGTSVLPFKSGLFDVAMARHKGEENAPDIPILPMAIQYRMIDGEPVTDANKDVIAWYREGDTMLPHLWGILKRRSIVVELHFFPMVHSHEFAHRKELAALCERQIRHWVESPSLVRQSTAS